MINKMPGLGDDKFKNLKAGYAFMMGHPGKKLLFMGQDFAQVQEWDEKRELDWYLLENPQHAGVQTFVRELLHLYKSHPALYEQDINWNGFEWINANDSYRSIFSFVRKSKDGKDNLLFVCNFTPMAYDDYRVGVPENKELTLLINSEQKKFQGTETSRKKKYKPEKKECDGKAYSIAYPLPAYGVAIFKY
jgi:1,4-alpha-glucan branching enzyme